MNEAHSKDGVLHHMLTGKEEREAQWAVNQRTLHGLQPKQVHISPEQGTYRELSEITEQAKRRAEITRSNKQVSQR